jgi:basic membrane protein A
MRRLSIVFGLFILVVLLGACSSVQQSSATQEPVPTDTQAIPTEPPSPIPPSETPKPFRVGVVSDVNGFDDGVWNAGALAGLVMARDALGVEIESLESSQESDYAAHIDTFVEQGFDVIVTVGAFMADTTQSAAQQNPEIYFVIVDHVFDPPLPNVLGVSYSADKSAFLAGYLAAGMTQNGVVGTFGSFNFPGINAYMFSFKNGVDYYNQQNAASVEVLGTDRYIESFDSQEDGRQVAEEFIASGADIILPVAGSAGYGSAQAVLENPGTMFIGVDFDWCLREEEYCAVTLTSIFNPIDVGVFQAIQQLKEGNLQGDVSTAIATLPLHDFEEVIPQELTEALHTVRQGLIDGSISTNWPPP